MAVDISKLPVLASLVLLGWFINSSVTACSHSSYAGKSTSTQAFQAFHGFDADVDDGSAIDDDTDELSATCNE
eukprot:CAMPEP_0198115450 /NCGR_PEP_ID=MMETSP1442-20131203/6554_1 /TAXON_ID= /ORGANISM="Craspedostauros australis, Strain CCMP3328" /LENGTH=72 /DNA_ID=CAMNT_0043772961 /DNA_START=39 /DNA_END=257 /DNA_ORIENTATION=-